MVNTLLNIIVFIRVRDNAILAMFVCLSRYHAQNVVRSIGLTIRKNKLFVRLVVITNLVSDVARKGMK